MVFIAWLMAYPPLPPQKFQKPAPIIGLTVSKVICSQISVLPVNVMLRPSTPMRGAIIELNCCEKNKRKGRESAPISTALLTALERSHPLLTIRNAPTTVQMKAVLLSERYKSQAPINSRINRSHDIR